MDDEITMFVYGKWTTFTSLIVMVKLLTDFKPLCHYCQAAWFSAVVKTLIGLMLVLLLSTNVMTPDVLCKNITVLTLKKVGAYCSDECSCFRMTCPWYHSHRKSSSNHAQYAFTRQQKMPCSLEHSAPTNGRFSSILVTAGKILWWDGQPRMFVKFFVCNFWLLNSKN